VRYETVPGVPRPVSKLTLGSMILPKLTQSEVDAMLEAWVEGGGTMVDTARVYGGGVREDAGGMAAGGEPGAAYDSG